MRRVASAVAAAPCPAPVSTEAATTEAATGEAALGEATAPAARTRRRSVPRAVPRSVLAAATAAYLAFIAWITLGPQPYDPSAAGLLDHVLALLRRTPATAWLTFDVVEFTANVALFVPLGVLLLLLLGVPRRWVVLALAVALTCGIELAQGAWLPTRVSDPRDVAANSGGAALGIALVLAGRRLLGRGR